MAIKHGYRYGERLLVEMFVDGDSADISPNDMVVYGTTAGYVKQAAANGTPVGVAVTGATSPTADGGARVTVDISDRSVYYFPTDTGASAVGLKLLTCDISGAQEIDIGESNQDCIRIVDVDTNDGGVFVQIITTAADAGVA